MKKNIQNILFFTCMLWLSSCLFNSCKKEIKPLDKLNGPTGLGGQLSFFNASEHILSQLYYGQNSTGRPGQSTILIDHAGDSLLSRLQLANKDYPIFNTEYKILAPTTFFNNTLPLPWVIYNRLGTGAHQLILLDTAGHSLIKTNIELDTDVPTTVFFADNLGVFSSWSRKDAAIRDNSGIGLQICQLSPDAGKVFFTINDNIPSGFPAAMKYGDITPFVAFKNPVLDTLRIKFYNVGDTTTVIARSFLPAAPAYSYTIILKGYMNGAAYQDEKNGIPITIVPNLQVFVTKTH